MSSPPSTGGSPKPAIASFKDKQKRVGSLAVDSSFGRNASDPFSDGADIASGTTVTPSTSKHGAGTLVAAPTKGKKDSAKKTDKKKVGLDYDQDGSRELTDALLARLMDQQETQEKQRQALATTSDINVHNRQALAPTSDINVHNRPLVPPVSSGSLPITPNTDTFPMPVGARTSSAEGVAIAPSGDENKDPAASDEIARLKAELAQAQTQISRLDTELLHQRGSASEVAAAGPPPFSRSDITDHVMFEGGHPRAPGPGYRGNGWNYYEGAPDPADVGLSNDLAINRPRSRGGPWNNSKTPWQGTIISPVPERLTTNNNWFGGGHRGFSQGYMDANGPYSLMDGPRGDRLTPDSDMLMRPIGNRRASRFESRYSSPNPFGGSNYGGYSPAPGHMDSLGPISDQGGHGPMGQYPPYGPQSGGTALSPHATEFQSTMAWKNEGGMGTEGPTYLPTTEPLNYRRLLDRNVNCDWKYIVDKIVCNNDQQASIFLQQKLKVGTPEQKYDIVEGIIAQAYPLMVNRFGNFLVQRCFEHGTPEQVVKIAEAIRGNTLNLSMDPFGCHVVQKAFDSVPEDYKAIMVHELLRRIPETVIHRYACHVWQKLFELRWSETPPQIMTYVNEALRGMWHEVALGETGSLVVQNIFENCLEDDKRPCIEEVLANIDIVAHGQFGNWCIQHICEHGAPADRSRAIDHVIRYAAEYSTDQFASKVVEKCLKVGGPEFLNRYLDRVCEGRHDRPRIPLIDIASDQYGNYLIQYILTHATNQSREVVAAHIRKHMVSLRGSKFGSRVGMLCTNPAAVTRPGPGVGPGMPRMGGGPPPRRAW